MQKRRSAFTSVTTVTVPRETVALTLTTRSCASVHWPPVGMRATSRRLLRRGAENGNLGASGRGRVSEGNPGYWRAYPCFRWPRNSPGKVWSSPSDVPAALGASPLPPCPHHPRQPGLRGRPRSSPWARHRPRRRRLFLFPLFSAPGLDLPGDAEAGETLLCGPDWPRWRWSLRPSGGAPTVEPRRAG